jgi:hypothetical protein
MNSKIGWMVIAVLVVGAVGSGGTAIAQTPDPMQSFFVPEAGPVAAPVTGLPATAFFRSCPDNDGSSSLPNAARIKVILKNSNGMALGNIPAADIYIQLNGGTTVQGFPDNGGADSVISNGTLNNSPACPNLFYITADAASDVNGVAYITFGGGDPNNPGTSLPSPGRKWGHYDSDFPVYANGVRIQGKFVEVGGAIGEYSLRIKSFDVKGGLANGNNQGEAVTQVDFNTVKGEIGLTDALSYWCDLNSSGAVDNIDLNIETFHKDHDCGTPP